MCDESSPCMLELCSLQHFCRRRNVLLQLKQRTIKMLSRKEDSKLPLRTYRVGQISLIFIDVCIQLLQAKKWKLSPFSLAHPVYTVVLWERHTIVLNNNSRFVILWPFLLIDAVCFLRQFHPVCFFTYISHWLPLFSMTFSLWRDLVQGHFNRKSKRKFSLKRISIPSIESSCSTSSPTKKYNISDSVLGLDLALTIWHWLVNRLFMIVILLPACFLKGSIVLF